MLFATLFRALTTAIGVPDGEAWRLLAQVALDGMHWVAAPPSRL